MDIGGNSSPIISNGDGAIGIEVNFDVGAIPG
jgi:hypothetical protein